MASASIYTKTALGLLYFGSAANYVKTYHYDIHSIHGPSMAPLLSPDYQSSSRKDIVLFKKDVRLADDYTDAGGSGKHSELKRGMVVSFLSPTSGNMAVKRIVALGGDKVRPLGRHNLSAEAKQQGLVVSEEYEEVTVPFGHVWVEGDQVDREKNLDSNSYGPISKSLIRGVATRILWPSDRQGTLHWEEGWEQRIAYRVVRTSDDHALPEAWMLH